MMRCLTEESHFKRTDISKKLRHRVARLGGATFVLVALIALASVVNANASALGIGAANDASRARVFDFEGVAPTDLRRERDIESEDEAFLDVAELKSTPSFGVTSIGATAQNSGASGQQQSQQTIATLTEIVDNLSQQLSRKDQKIEFLEKQIYELKSEIGEDVSVGSLALVPVQPPLISEVGNVSTNALAVESSAPANQTAPLWPWLSLCFFALSSSIYLMRARLYTLGQSLNLFGFNDQLEFNSVAEQTLSHSDLDVYRQSKLRSTEAHSPKSKIQSPTDDVITGTIETSMADRDILEDISYLGLSDDGSYEANGDLGFEANAITDDLEDLSFDQRFEQLLAEKDFAFARELLDFTRYNEINDERYHCQRLRLLEKMQDEDGFYAYYYGIESQISTFPQNLQTQISRLVVMLAHR